MKTARQKDGASMESMSNKYLKKNKAIIQFQKMDANNAKYQTIQNQLMMEKWHSLK